MVMRKRSVYNEPKSRRMPGWIRGIFAVFFLVFCIGCTPLPAYAASTSIVDDAGLLDDSGKETVQSLLDSLKEESGWTLIALTTNDAGGKTAEEYADDYVDTHACEEDGVCFLIDMDNRQIHITTTGNAIEMLTDERIDDILDSAYSYAGDEDYTQCFVQMIDGTKDYFEQGMESGQYTYDRDTGKIIQAPNRITGFDVAIALIAGVAAGGAVIAVIAGKYRLKIGKWSYDFRGNSDLSLSREDDRLVNQFVTHHHIQRDNGNHGGGNSGQSTVHTSSGGGTHGGGSHSF